MCSCQLQSFENTRPRCLCDVTSLITCWAILRGGWIGLLCLREKIIDSDLDGLKVTNHFEAQLCNLVRSALRVFAASKGLATMIYRLVPSANSLILE